MVLTYKYKSKIFENWIKFLWQSDTREQQELQTLPITIAVTTNVCFEGIFKVLYLTVTYLKPNMKHKHIF